MTYWVPTAAAVNQGRALLTLRGWRDRAAYDSGQQPLETRQVSLGPAEVGTAAPDLDLTPLLAALLAASPQAAPQPAPAPAPAPAAPLLFNGNFSGASLSRLAGDFDKLVGTDDTGFPWQGGFWKGNWGIHHYNRGQATQIIDTTGPKGNRVKALRLKVLDGADSQAQETMMFNPATADQGPLYLRADLRLAEDVAQQLVAGGPFAGGIYRNWRNVWEIKSGDPTGGNAGMGDFRLILGLRKLAAGIRWYMQVDTNANSPTSEVPYVIHANQEIAGPIPQAGEWFQMETYFDRGAPGKDNGQWWVKVNGQLLYTHRGRMWGNKQKPWNRLMFVTYTNATPGHAMDVTDIRIAAAAP